MRGKKRLVILVACLPLLGSCQTNEQTGGLMGGIGGGVLGAGLAKAFGGNTTTTMLAAAAGGAAGYFLGSAIGRQLDERDRQLASSATQEVLDEPTYQATQHPAVWHSDHTNAHGSARVVAVHPQSSGTECKTVQEVAYIKGEEVRQNTRYCQSPDGSWASA